MQQLAATWCNSPALKLRSMGFNQVRCSVGMRIKRTGAAIVLLALSAGAYAGAPQPFSEDLFLDWGDLRSMLRDMGVDVRIGYVSETATNVQGGPEELWRYTDQWTFLTQFDLQKLMGIDAATFRVTITDRNGRDLGQDANLNTLQLVQEVYGRDQTWRWTQVWYDQQYLNGKLDWKVGRLTEGEDFAAFSCEFQNLTFCGAQPGNLVGSYWYNWPVSQWGTRLKTLITGFGYVQIGAFEVNPDYLLNKYGMDLWRPGSATGVLAPLEFAWLPTFYNRPGSYKVGGWYNSSTAPDVVSNTAEEPLEIAGGTPRMHHGQYGAYLSFEQRLTAPMDGDAKRGLSVFLNATYADRRTSTLDSQIALGMLYRGPFAARPRDEIGLAVGETHVNSRIAALERLQNGLGDTSVPVQSEEWASELFYNVNVGGWLDLRPNLQYIAQPGGVASRTNDVIAGLKLAINF